MSSTVRRNMRRTASCVIWLLLSPRSRCRMSWEQKSPAASPPFAFFGRVACAFDNYAGPFVSIDVLLTWGTSRFAAASVHHELRKQGASGYTLRKLIKHAINMMTGFTTLPLQLASLMGFGFTLFGIFVLGYVLLRYFLHGSPVPEREQLSSRKYGDDRSQERETSRLEPKPSGFRDLTAVKPTDYLSPSCII